MAKTDTYIQRLKYYVNNFRRWNRQVIIKSYKSVRYRAWLKIKSISFKSREQKIKEFDELVRINPHIYFTTRLVNTGFTDQLIGFLFLYKLGKGLGLKYFHTPLSSHRSSVPFWFTESKEKASETKGPDVFDFLGLNSFLESQSGDVLPGQMVTFQINMEAIPLKRYPINTYDTLLEEMKVILHSFLDKNCRILLTFKCGPKTYFKYYRLVAHRTDYEINYLQIFKNKKRKSRHVSRFRNYAIKMLVHIRQGDTGIIKTPWNTYIPTWHKSEKKFIQYKSREDIKINGMIDVEVFYTFLKDLFDNIEPSKFSTALYSDGFKKTFSNIYRNYKSRNISREEIARLKEIESGYNEQEFGRFRDLENVETVIGEEIEKLHDLIYSFMEAEVLLCGTQGKMIPKFVATYGDKKSMPLIIMLYDSSSEKPDLNFIGIDNSAEYLLYVDIHNYDIHEIYKKIEEHQKNEAL